MPTVDSRIIALENEQKSLKISLNKYVILLA